jgi:MFS family permease
MSARAIPAAFPSPARARRAVICLALIGFSLSMDITLTTLLNEPLKREMVLSDVQIGLLQGTAFGMAFGISSIPLSRLIDRGNRMRLLGAGLLIWAAAMVGTALAPGFAALVVARVLLGMVAALLIPAAFSLIADLYPPDGRSVATSMFVVGQALGQAVGVLAGGLAFDALTHSLTLNPHLLFGLTAWRALYVATAMGGLLPLALLITIREPTRQEAKKHPPSPIEAFQELYRHRGLLLPLFAALVFTQITMQATSVWAPPVLTRNFGLTPGQFAGWLSAVNLLGGILGAVAGGRLGEAGRKHGGRTRVLRPAMMAALAIAPLSLFGMAPGVAGFAVLLLGAILAGAIVATIGVIAITLNIPNDIRGLALGANVLCSTLLGTATAPAAIALLSGWLGGEGQVGLAIAGLCIPAALLSALCFALAIRADRPVSGQGIPENMQHDLPTPHAICKLD